MPAPAPPRDRLLEAAYRCVARRGLARTTIDDVAREAGMSRPTVYRYFPGGREALLREVVAWEAGRFIGDLTRAVAPHPDLASSLEELVMVAADRMAGHEVLQKVLQTEPERLLPLLVLQTDRLIGLVKPFLLLAMQRAPLRPGLDADAAADHLARMVLSVIASPGRWNLKDRDEVAVLVRDWLLAALM